MMFRKSTNALAASICVFFFLVPGVHAESWLISQISAWGKGQSFIVSTTYRQTHRGRTAFYWQSARFRIEEIPEAGTVRIALISVNLDVQGEVAPQTRIARDFGDNLPTMTLQDTKDYIRLIVDEKFSSDGEVKGIAELLESRTFQHLETRLMPDYIEKLSGGTDVATLGDKADRKGISTRVLPSQFTVDRISPESVLLSGWDSSDDPKNRRSTTIGQQFIIDTANGFLVSGVSQFRIATSIQSSLGTASIIHVGGKQE